MEQVKEMLLALSKNYLLALPSHIDQLEQLLLELESNGFELERVRELFRRLHSLKGSGGTYGLHIFSDVCHPFEDLISSLLENPGLLKTSFMETALWYVDLMRTVQSIYLRGQEPGPEIGLALQGLRQRTSQTFRSALIVENSEVVVGILEKILKSHHFRIEVVNDGYIALGRMLSESFDVLITGLETKRLNGLVLIGALQKSGNRFINTKTILLTSTIIESENDRPDYIVKKDADLKGRFDVIMREILAPPLE